METTNKKGAVMEQSFNEMVVNGVTYVPKGSEVTMADSRDGMKYVIVRTNRAGVFAGFLESRKGQETVMRDARRLWYWDGAASLSQMAMEGTKAPDACKFPVAVDRVELLDAVEILDVTAQARASIEGVKVWTR